ncbi:MAG: TPM domain-containing protein [Candidatus Woesearchaeota archaeon]|nr:TPM domain-containing protein [Candidatus Woesearchaeota archaeon]
MMIVHNMKKAILLSMIFLLVYFVSAINFPKPVGYVNDFAGIIDSNDEVKISNFLADLEKNTTVEIAVVIMDSLNGTGIEEYSVKLFEEWGIGKKENDNGLLLLIAINDRAYRFEVGYGLEGTLNAAMLGRIGRDILNPYFARQEYGEGVYNVLAEISGVIKKDPDAVAKYQAQKININMSGFSSPLIMLYLTFLVIWLFISQTPKKTAKKIGLFGAGELAAIISAFFLGLIVFIAVIFFSIIFFILFVALIAGASSQGHKKPPIYFGGFGRGGLGGGGFGGGGFGGFGGGSSGGGGFSGRW